MSKHNDTTDETNLVVDIDTNQTDDDSVQPSTPFEPSNSSDLNPTQDTLERLERFKACFKFAFLIGLYTIFQFGYIMLHKFVYEALFYILVYTLFGNLILCMSVGFSMKRDNIKKIKTMSTIFAFINFNSVCQIAELFGPESTFSESSKVGKVFFFLNIFLLVYVGVICSFVVVSVTFKWVGRRMCKLGQSCTDKTRFWDKFYKCCVR